MQNVSASVRIISNWFEMDIVSLKIQAVDENKETLKLFQLLTEHTNTGIYVRNAYLRSIP